MFGDIPSQVIPPYTKKQGQYLAFIYYYAKINGRAPAEADIQQYFRVSPPSAHQMILTLEQRGFISRVPGQGRSITLRLRRDQRFAQALILSSRTWSAAGLQPLLPWNWQKRAS